MEIKKLVVGNTTEVLIRTLFDNRIAEESTSEDLNSVSRAIRIKDLMNQTLSFIKRNPNSKFIVVAPEFKSEKDVKLSFSNFTEMEDDEDARYQISIRDNFIEADIVHFVEVGNNIKLTLKAEE